MEKKETKSLSYRKAIKLLNDMIAVGDTPHCDEIDCEKCVFSRKGSTFCSLALIQNSIMEERDLLTSLQKEESRRRKERKHGTE